MFLVNPRMVFYSKTFSPPKNIFKIRLECSHIHTLSSLQSSDDLDRLSYFQYNFFLNCEYYIMNYNFLRISYKNMKM